VSRYAKWLKAHGGTGDSSTLTYEQREYVYRMRVISFFADSDSVVSLISSILLLLKKKKRRMPIMRFRIA